MTTEAIDLPKGVGQLPTWWLEEVPHETRDDVLRKRRRIYRQSIGLPKESHEEETKAIEKEKQRLDSISAISMRSLTAGNEKESSTMTVTAIEQVAREMKETEDESDIGVVPTPEKPFKFNITMTSTEEDAVVEARRQKDVQSEDYGQDKLRARPGNVKTVDSVKLDQNLGGSAKDQATVGVSRESRSADSRTTSIASVRSGSTRVVASESRHQQAPEAPKKYNTAFTGVSPFDFAMQQRAKEKERREKERISREGLAQHHGALLMADKAAEHKAKEEEERRKKKEAEELLKMFKAADLDKQYEVAAELKKLQIEDKQKKKEAEEHLKGYRER